MFGNAFNAKLYAATANFSAGDFLWFKDAIIDGKIVATQTQNIVDLANTGQVRIINNSWGSSTTLPFNASLPTVLASFNRNYGDFYKPVLDKDVLVVFSAGNGYGVHAGIDAAAPLNDPRLRSNWLSVANYSSFTAPDPSTSFCGQTATWCVRRAGVAGGFVGAGLHHGPRRHPGAVSPRQLCGPVFGDDGVGPWRRRRSISSWAC